MSLLIIRALIGIAFSFIILSVFGHYIARTFETGFLSPRRKRFLYDLSRRIWIYFLPILLFGFTSIGGYIAPKIQFDAKVYQKVQTQPEIIKENVYENIESNPLEDILNFGIVKGALWAGIVIVALLVMMVRFLSMVYHSFLVRQIIFYMFFFLIFNVFIFIVNPVYHKVFIDYLVIPIFAEYIIFSFLASLIIALLSDLLIKLFREIWGHKADSAVMKGLYRCTQCFETTRVDEDYQILPKCSNIKCKWTTYVRIR